MNQSDPDDIYVHSDEEDYLTEVIVDTCSRKYILHSNSGDVREVLCDTVQQFMDVLETVKLFVDEDYIFYSNPITTED